MIQNQFFFYHLTLSLLKILCLQFISTCSKHFFLPSFKPFSNEYMKDMIIFKWERFGEQKDCNYNSLIAGEEARVETSVSCASLDLMQ